jgi:hypothetical protein
MACCSGVPQIATLKMSLYWRSQVDQERRMIFNATLADNKWNGEGSGSYDLSTMPLGCGECPVRGDAVTIRGKLELRCTESDPIRYMKGLLQMTLGKSRFQVRLKPVTMSCVSTQVARWDLLFMRDLGVGRLIATRGI